MPDDIDVAVLEPADGEEEESKALIVLGFDFGEMIALCNGIASACLAFMSLFGRSKSYGDISFLRSCTLEYERLNPETPLSATMNTAYYTLFVLERFYNEAISTVGGSLVFDSTLALSAALTLAIQLELSRRRGVEAYGPTGAALAALLPIVSHILGPATVCSLVLCWMWRTRREAKLLPRTDGLPSNDVDVLKTALFVTTCLFHLTLMFVALRSGGRTPGQGHPQRIHVLEVVLLWLLPTVPSLLSMILPLQPSAKPRQVRMLSGTAALACFLLIGAAGLTVHGHGFSQLDPVLKEGGGQAIVDSIVKDSLSMAPSRFFFVQFFHLVISALMFMARQTDGSGGTGLVLFVTSLIGPAGAFGLVAAHHQFQLMRDDGVI